MIQVCDVSQAFIQGFSDGITISIGIETGNKMKEGMANATHIPFIALYKNIYLNLKIINYAGVL